MLALLWGASYLFIKIALTDLSPAMVVFGRTALAALVLVPIALARRALRASAAGSGRWSCSRWCRSPVPSC